jgi:hypothetical protein
MIRAYLEKISGNYTRSNVLLVMTQLDQGTGLAGNQHYSDFNKVSITKTHNPMVIVIEEPA